MVHVKTAMSKEEDQEADVDSEIRKEVFGFPWELGTIPWYDYKCTTGVRLDWNNRYGIVLDFFRRNEEVLLCKVSREDEQKQSSQFQNEDHVQVIDSS